MIDWSIVKYFSEKEKWSEDPNQYAEPKLIYTLDKFREILQAPVNPSPVTGALARFDSSITSRHYAVNRKSDAIDIFCDCDFRKAWTLALTMPEIGGVGLYFDTIYRGKDHKMLHLDLRPSKTLWFRTANGYHYPLKNSTDLNIFFNLMQEGGI